MVPFIRMWMPFIPLIQMLANGLGRLRTPDGLRYGLLVFAQPLHDGVAAYAQLIGRFLLGELVRSNAFAHLRPRVGAPHGRAPQMYAASAGGRYALCLTLADILALYLGNVA